MSQLQQIANEIVKKAAINIPFPLNVPVSTGPSQSFLEALMRLGVDRQLNKKMKALSLGSQLAAGINAARGGSFARSMSIGAGAGILNHLLSKAPTADWRHALLTTAIELPATALAHGIGRLFYKPPKPTLWQKLRSML